MTSRQVHGPLASRSTVHIFKLAKTTLFLKPRLATVIHPSTLPANSQRLIPRRSSTATFAMRRAAARSLRTSLQCTVRGLSRTSRRGSIVSPVSAAGARHLSSTSSHNSRVRPRPDHALLGDPLKSSMYYRRASAALVSALVGYGAYNYYGGNGTESQQASISRAYSSGKPTGDDVPLRPVLIIGADEIATGTFAGEGPISKTTDEDGRRVLEMLTPEQATQKLRKSEQSYFVNRGKGVIRYDLDQLPSNDPIEDDHAEKIVEVPSKSEQGNDDWMFWGVFDGHSCVSSDLHGGEIAR